MAHPRIDAGAIIEQRAKVCDWRSVALGIRQRAPPTGAGALTHFTAMQQSGGPAAIAALRDVCGTPRRADCNFESANEF